MKLTDEQIAEAKETAEQIDAEILESMQAAVKKLDEAEVPKEGRRFDLNQGVMDALRPSIERYFTKKSVKKLFSRNAMVKKILKEGQHSMTDAKGNEYVYEQVIKRPMLNEAGLPLERKVARRTPDGKWDGKTYDYEPCYLMYHSTAVRKSYDPA